MRIIISLIFICLICINPQTAWSFLQGGVGDLFNVHSAKMPEEGAIDFKLNGSSQTVLQVLRIHCSSTIIPVCFLAMPRLPLLA